ncbi:hypothetical protein ACOSQ4_004876 [Xanthoceras sorbifolium]
MIVGLQIIWFFLSSHGHTPQKHLSSSICMLMHAYTESHSQPITHTHTLCYPDALQISFYHPQPQILTHHIVGSPNISLSVVLSTFVWLWQLECWSPISMQSHTFDGCAS